MVIAHMSLRKYFIFRTKDSPPREKANIMKVQSIHDRLETKKYFKLNIRQFHSSNLALCP